MSKKTKLLHVDGATFECWYSVIGMDTEGRENGSIGMFSDKVEADKVALRSGMGWAAPCKVESKMVMVVPDRPGVGYLLEEVQDQCHVRSVKERAKAKLTPEELEALTGERE